MVAVFRTTAHIFTASIMLAMMLAACSPFGPPPDPGLGNKQLQNAERLFSGRQYAAAADEIGLAAQNLPHNGHLVVRQGEFLEYLGRVKEARQVYRRGLKQAADNLDNIRFHLAKLEIFHFQQADTTRKLAAQLPAFSWQRADLDALVLIYQGKNQEALNTLLRIYGRLPDESAEAFVSFHIAVAKEKLGYIDSSYASLHRAVNRVQHKGLSRDIEIFWEHLNLNYPRTEP